MQTVSSDLATEVKDNAQTVLPRVTAQWADNRVLDNLKVYCSSDSWYNSTLDTQDVLPDVYWRMNDASIPIQDYSGHGFNGANSGTSTLAQASTPLTGDTTSKSASLSAGYFQFVSTSSCSFNNANATIEVWVKTSSGVSRGLFSNFGGTGGEACVETDASGNLIFTVTGTAGTITTTTNINDNIWHYIALTKSGTLWTLYSDGIAIGNLTKAGPGNFNTCWAGTSNAHGWNGNICEFVSTPRAKSALEISARYRQIAAPKGYTFFIGREAFNARKEQGFAWGICDSVDEFNRPIAANGKFYTVEDTPSGRYEYGWRSSRLASVASGTNGNLPTYNDILYASFNQRKANYINVYLPDNYGATNALNSLYWIDSVGARRLPAVDMNSNLFPDSSFESGVVGIWAIANNTGGTFDVVTQTVQDGAKAMRLVPNATVSTIFTPTSGVNMIRINPSTQYDFSYYNLASANSTGFGWTPSMVWYDITGAVISTSTGTFQFSSTSVQRNNINATSPANAYYVSCQLTTGATPSGNSFYVDAVQLKQGALAAWQESAPPMSLQLLGKKTKFPLLIDGSATDVTGVYVVAGQALYQNDTVNIEEIEVSYEEDVSGDVVSMEIEKTRDNYDSSVPVGATSSNTFSMALGNTDKTYNVKATTASKMIKAVPLAMWRLNDPKDSLTAADTIGTRTGTYVNAPMLNIPGRLAGEMACYFTSANSQSVNTGDLSLFEAGDCSYVAWFKTSTVAGQYIFNEAGGTTLARVGIDGTGHIVFDGINDATTAFNITGPVVTDGAFHNVVMVKSGTSVVLYLDGAALGVMTPASLSGTFTITASGIGKDMRTGGTQYFNGTIECVATYNRALSAAEALDIYNDNRTSTRATYIRKDVRFDVSLGWKFGTVDEPSVAPVAWYKASAPLYTTAAGSTLAVNDGDSVARWTDLTPNALHATTAIAANRLVLKTGVNGLNGYPVLRSDGVSDVLVAPLEAFLPTQTVFCVTKKLSAPGASLNPVWAFSTRAYLVSWGNALGANYGWVFGQDSANNTTTPNLGGIAVNWNITVVRLTYGSTKAWIGGGSGVTFNPETYAQGIGWFTTPSAFNLGGVAGVSWGDFDIAEALRYNVNMSLSDINLVGNYLAQKYGLTWTTAT